MNTQRLILIATCLALALPITAKAWPMGEQRCERNEAPHKHAEHMTPEAGFMEDGGPVPPFLRGIDLTETQRDAIFNILHTQAPLLRDKMKAVRKAHEALHALTLSNQYDETRAKELVATIADITGLISLLHAQTEHQVFALLTPGQKKQLEKIKSEIDLHATSGATSGTFSRTI